MNCQFLTRNSIVVLTQLRATNITFKFLLLFLMASTNSFSQSLISDSFNGSTVNANCNWKFPNYYQNLSNYYSTTGSGELLIYATGDGIGIFGGSDLCYCTNFYAPYLVQAVDTANHNFQIETRLRFNPTNHWQSAGIVFQTQSNDTNARGLMRIANRFNYQGAQAVGAIGASAAYTDTMVYFRVQRAFGDIRTWYSENGSTWNLLSTIPDTTIYSVGLVAESYDWSHFTFTDSYAYFDYFNVSTVDGIDDMQNQQSLYIYPNPTKDKLTISILNRNSSNRIIKIKNILSETILEHELTGSEINLNVSKLSSGVYFVTLENPSGTIVKKFIKE